MFGRNDRSVNGLTSRTAVILIDLAIVFSLCSILSMTRIDETTLSDALLAAPGWARVGLSAPTVGMRENAARELARVILDEMEQASTSPCEQEQLPL